MAPKDGGPAFPVGEQAAADGSKYYDCIHHGMTLRDYFAIHGNQPGQLEMAAEAGVMLREHSGLKWDNPEAQALPTFVEWFHKLPQPERYRLYAACRYRIADAMLAERDK